MSLESKGAVQRHLGMEEGRGSVPFRPRLPVRLSLGQYVHTVRERQRERERERYIYICRYVYMYICIYINISININTNISTNK